MSEKKNENSNQIIISICRKFGSQGHEIANRLGKELGLPVVDKDLLHLMAENHGFNPEELREYDEKPRNRFLSSEVRGYSNSIEQILADMVFKYQNDLVATGGSFIFVGRCATWNLRNCKNHVRIFITADDKVRIKYIADSRDLTKKEAESLMNKMDKRRRNYNIANGNEHWGEAEGYDLIVDSSVLGVDGSVKLIKEYVSIFSGKDGKL